MSINLSDKIKAVEADIEAYKYKAKKAYLQHTFDKFTAIVKAKKKHLKDLKQIQEQLNAITYPNDKP